MIWIRPPGSTTKSYQWQCTKCGRVAYNVPGCFTPGRYCPHCGDREETDKPSRAITWLPAGDKPPKGAKAATARISVNGQKVLVPCWVAGTDVYISTDTREWMALDGIEIWESGFCGEVEK